MGYKLQTETKRLYIGDLPLSRRKHLNPTHAATNRFYLLSLDCHGQWVCNDDTYNDDSVKFVPHWRAAALWR